MSGSLVRVVLGSSKKTGLVGCFWSGDADLLGTDGLHQSIGGHGFRAFDWQTQSAIPDERGQHTESTGNAEQNGVVVHFLQSVVLQQDTGVGIYVGPWVLDLAEFGQDWGHNLVDVGNQLEQRIVWQVLQGELALASVARIGLTQDSVTVARNDLK